MKYLKMLSSSILRSESSHFVSYVNDYKGHWTRLRKLTNWSRSAINAHNGVTQIFQFSIRVTI